MKIEQLNGRAQINLEGAGLLLLERSTQGADILAQVLGGFGARNIYRCTNVKDAEDAFRNNVIDLILIDPSSQNDAGYEFINTVRRSKQKPNCFAPVIVVTGHTQISNVTRLRDSGANFTIAKPIVPKVLLERILWLARVERAYIDSEVYAGPDRRHKFEGPPAGADGRRGDDLPLEVGAASAPNLSQGQIDGLVRPQKVTL